MNTSTIELLRVIPNLAALDDSDLRRIAELLAERAIERGELLTEEGATGDCSFLVLEGEATVVSNGVPIARVGPGEFVGELALLTNAPRGASVEAVTPMRVLVLDRTVLMSLLDPITEALLGTLARRLQRTSEQRAGHYVTGANIALRSRYNGAWVDGFEIAEIDLSGQDARLQVRRKLDGAILPVAFAADEIRLV